MKTPSITLLTFLLCLSFLQLLGQNLQDGLISRYKFDGTSGFDEEGYNSATVVSAFPVEDRFGNANSALHFNANGTYVEMPDRSEIDFQAQQDFTISLWVNIASTQNDLSGNQNEIVAKWRGHTSTSYPYAIRFANSNSPSSHQFRLFVLRFDSDACGGNPVILANCTISRNAWHHVVFRKKGSELMLFQDGVVVGSTFDTTDPACETTNNEVITVGARGQQALFFTGEIDDLRFYKRALTNTEIQLLLSENNWAPPPNNELEFLSFSLPGQVDPPTINTTTKRILVKMPCNQNLSDLVANFTLTSGATAKVGAVNQVSGATTNDFTNIVTYTLNDTGCSEQLWEVEVETVSTGGDANFLAFSLPGQTTPAQIDATLKQIVVTMPCDADLSTLAAEFTLSTGAEASVNGVSQNSDVTINNYYNPVVYTVTLGCTSSEWTVLVESEEGNGAPGIVSFSLPNETDAAEINIQQQLITVTMPCNTDLSNLIATFTLSEDAQATINGTIQVNNVTSNDFNNPVIYTVISDCIETEWTIIVVMKQDQGGLDILSYSIPGQVGNSVIDTTEKTISITIPCGASRDNLVAKFSNSSGAYVYVNNEIQHSGFTPNNFNAPVAYYLVNYATCTSSTWRILVANALPAELSAYDSEDPAFQIPNIITPDEDGKNDKYLIGSFFKGSQLYIFNRWGTEVYQSDNYQNDFSGGDLSAGIYYCLLKNACIKKPIRFTLHIKR